jgi:toxin YoeB
MKLCFTPSAWEDYLWFQQHDRKLLKRINQLIKDVLRSQFEGIGKPEPLKGETWLVFGHAVSMMSIDSYTRPLAMM